MEKSRIYDLLRRLGFFYVHEEIAGTTINFLVGHISPPPFVAASLNTATGDLKGHYADILNQIDRALEHFDAESQNVISLPTEVRQAWIKNLAHEAGLSLDEFRFLTSSAK